MNSVKDCLNRNIRITNERVQHIKENHPELALDDFDEKITGTLQSPEIIVSSISDETAELFINIFSILLLAINGCALCRANALKFLKPERLILL